MSIFPLTLQDVEIKRRGRAILGPVSLELGATGLTVLMGPNGSGKTTLLRAMHGIERLSAGRLSWAVDENAARAAQAYVFQSPVMLRRSVADNLRYPLDLDAVPSGEATRLIEHWIQRIGFADLADAPATGLSGGERQKLALARSLIRQPDVLFLDEPCANLDGRSTKEIEALLRETHAAGTRIILATHDIGQAKRLATDAVFMLSGQIHERADAGVFFDAPETAELAAFLKGDIVE